MAQDIYYDGKIYIGVTRSQAMQRWKIVKWLDETESAPAAALAADKGWTKFDKNNIETFPPIGELYNVVWDLEDGEDLTTTSMEWDAINKRWRDVIGVPEAEQKILYWQPLPEPPIAGYNAASQLK